MAENPNPNPSDPLVPKPGTQANKAQTVAAFKQQQQDLQQLEKKVALMNGEEPANQTGAENARGYAFGVKILSEFIAALVVGIFMGYWLGRWFEQLGLGVVLGFFLGIVTAFYNLFRSVQAQEAWLKEQKNQKQPTSENSG